MKPKLNILNNSEELFDNFAMTLISIINNSKNNKVNIALSGGSTPKKLFNTLVNNYNNKVGWNKVNFWWGDERCVPPTDSESNFGMTKNYLFDHIELNDENIFRIMGENDQVEEAERYSKLIIKNVNSINQIPSFDIMLLGLGKDGHVASIFPNQIELFDSDQLCAPAINPYSKKKRVSMTGKLINNAQNISILLSGIEKSEIVNKILNNNHDKKYPVNHINPTQGSYNWYLDKEASLIK